MSDNENGFGLDLGFEVGSIKKSSNTHPAGTFDFEIQRGKITMNQAEDIKTLELTLVNVETQKRAFIRHVVASTRKTMEGMVAAGHDRIKELGEATGISGSNLDGIIGQVVQATIIVREGKNGYEDSNEVRKYKPAGGAAPTVSQPGSNKPGFMARK